MDLIGKDVVEALIAKEEIDQMKEIGTEHSVGLRRHNQNHEAEEQ